MQVTSELETNTANGKDSAGNIANGAGKYPLDSDTYKVTLTIGSGEASTSTNEQPENYAVVTTFTGTRSDLGYSPAVITDGQIENAIDAFTSGGTYSLEKYYYKNYELGYEGLGYIDKGDWGAVDCPVNDVCFGGLEGEIYVQLSEMPEIEP
jgi:hypothetical protein